MEIMEFYVIDLTTLTTNLTTQIKKKYPIDWLFVNRILPFNLRDLLY